MPNRSSHVSALLFGFGALLLTPNVLLAQDALGSGNALDNNLNASEGRINPTQAGENFRARNLIITNNVLGGRGFRGSVGYGAANDFRGTTGSELSDAFLAETAWTNVNLMNFGDTYNQFRFGQESAIFEFRNTATGTSGERLNARGVAFGERSIQEQLRLDQFNFASSLNVSSQGTIEPTDVGIARMQGQPAQFITASSIFGLQFDTASESIQAFGISTYDRVRIVQDIMAQRGSSELGAPFNPDLEQRLAESDASAFSIPVARNERNDPDPDDPRIGNQTVNSRIDVNVRDVEMVSREADQEFDRILSRVATQYAQLEANDRDLLPMSTGSLEPGTETGNRSGTLAEEFDLRIEELRKRLLRIKGVTPPTEDESEEESEEVEDPLSVDPYEGLWSDEELGVLGRVLRHGEQITTLSTDDQSRFSELMTEGQTYLQSGEYFHAERTFSRALRLTPGHPLGTAGMIHAQIGSGLYGSAALALRSLYSFQPIMIDATFAPELVPNRLRLNEAVNTLESRIEQGQRLGDYGLLLAYIGRLMNDDAVLKTGMDAMARSNQYQELYQLLNELWLNGQGLPPLAGE